MEFSSVQSAEKRKGADLLVLPFWKDKKSAFVVSQWKKLIELPLRAGDFSGKEGEVLIQYVSGQPEKGIALLGLGEEDSITVEKLRRAYSSLAKTCHTKKAPSLNLLLPLIKMDEKEIVRGISEGLLLTNYSFDKLKHASVKEDPKVLLKKGVLIGAGKTALAEAKKYQTISEAVYFVRDLSNGNADDITPQYLSKSARQLAKQFPKVNTTVFDRKRIEKEKMGLLLAVNRGSPRDPVFIICEYKGNPKSKDLTVILGKGITYDTGGLSLKTSTGMLDMRSDMSGAAAALGTIQAAASLGMKVNVTAVIASTENCIGGKSYKPGDVHVGYSGKTVEIGNTDAEGRLVLADALAYTEKKLKPSRMIDMATLTGAVGIALGEEASGLMTDDDTLAEALIKAGEQTFDRVWRLPLYPECRNQIESDVADIINTGGRFAALMTSGLFLKEFVEKTPWAHLDIAGTAFLSKARRYQPKNATGVGVRLMIQFLENL